MKIGIIGIGNIGGSIARKLKAAGHEIRVANSRGPESVRRFADEIGATAADVNGAVDGVDVIFLSIPLPAIAELPNGLLKAVPEDVLVVDTSNYYPGMRDPRIPEIDQGMPESIWVSRQLGRPVIKGCRRDQVLSGFFRRGAIDAGVPAAMAPLRLARK